MSIEDIARATIIKFLESNSTTDQEHSAELLQEVERLKSIWLIQSRIEAPDLLSLIPIYSTEQKAKICKDAGNVALGHGNFDEAIDKLTEAIQLMPNEMDLYLVRADAYLKKGFYPQAIQDFQIYLSCKQNNAAAFLRLGYAFLMVNEIGNAKNIIQEGLNQFPDDPSLLATKNLILTNH